MTSRPHGLVGALGAAALSAAPARALAQCAMCGTAIQSPEDPLARGLFWSVVFLISLPYTIVAGFILAIFWASRRSKSARTAHVGPRLLNPAGLHVVHTKEENRP